MKIERHTTAGDCINAVATVMAESGLYFGHGTDNPGAEAQWLVCAVLTQDGLTGITESTPVTCAQQVRIDTLLKRRVSERLPLAYLLGEAWFAGHCFYVDQRVLVPRSPIAELVRNGFEPLLGSSPATILDLCSGSGCIGIACALAFPDSRVILADLSGEALDVAAINITRFGLEERVTVRQSDLYAAVPEQFDLIVCNPPYVPEAEYRGLAQEYLHEPAMGLVSAQDGLEIPLRILEQSAIHLHEEGILILETGHTWQALDTTLPELAFLWLDFEFGGEGVCALTREQLHKYFQNHSGASV